MAMELVRRPWAGAAGGDLMRDYVPLRTMVDRLFESAFTPALWGNGVRGGFGMDVYETDDAYTIHCLLPGVDPSKVAVTVQDHVLTVSGESTRPAPENARPLFQEIGFGQFRRQVTLDAPVDAGKAEADYHDGILRITLPKAEAARPKSIQVRTTAVNGATR